MLCVARGAVGLARVGWWAVWNRAHGELHEHTRRSARW
jgi:hypothetical protein